MNHSLGWLLEAHIYTLFASFVIYLMRGLLHLDNLPWVQSRFLIICSALSALLVLVSGFLLAFSLRMPFVDGFAITSMLGLISYTGVAVIAFNPHLGKGTSIIFWLSGLLLFAYIYFMSINKLPSLY